MMFKAAPGHFQITAKVLEHSVFNKTGKEMITFVITYPRFILAELNTHRQESKNSASSRAVPTIKFLRQVWNDPAMPVEWGKHPKEGGMQAHEQLTGFPLWACKFLWKFGTKMDCCIAYLQWKLGLAKQLTNRRLELGQIMTTIISGTDWDNLWELRDHPDAQPEFRELARAMRAAMAESRPRVITPLMLGTAWGWHLPYITDQERNTVPLYSCIQMSAARTARVSYMTHEGKAPDLAGDIARFERLVGSVPLHASPIEHEATPAPTADHRSGNFNGWIQFRKVYWPGKDMNAVLLDNHPGIEHDGIYS